MYFYTDEFHRPDFDTMISTTVRLLEEHNIRFDNPCRIFVDAANPSFITTLKQAVNEDSDYVKPAFYKKNYPSVYIFAVLTTEYVCDSRSKELLEYQSGHISIHPRFNKLITALRTAIADEWSLDKKATSHDDLLVAFSMSLQY